MHSRWGSCNSKKGYINLNLYLIRKDIRFIEYVILHELAHLIHPNHSKDFYRFIENIMPDFKERIKNGI
jgi:predicted metal-dependent hydrolase